MVSATRTPYPIHPAFAGSLLNVPPTDWAKILIKLLEAFDRQSRQAAREEYKLLLAEQAEAAAEADRNDQVLTVAQTAELLGLQPQSIYEWIKAGKLQAFKMGRAVRLKRGQVMAALQAQTLPDGRRKYARRATNKKSR